MKKTTSDPKPAKGKTPVAERVLYLLEKLWHGNRSAMARDLGLSHSVVNRIAYGEQLPGPKFMKALADHQSVNAKWLYDGTGEPFRGASTELVGRGGLLPVADHVLPGSPVGHAGHFASRLDLLSPAWIRPSRYLLRVGADWPLLREPKIDLRAGDLLLVETDPIWHTNPAVLIDRLIAVDTGSHGFQIVTAAALAKETLPLPTEQDRVREEFIRRFGRLPHGLQFDATAESSVTKSDEAISVASPAWKVLGVVLLVIRM